MKGKGGRSGVCEEGGAQTDKAILRLIVGPVMGGRLGTKEGGGGHVCFLGGAESVDLFRGAGCGGKCKYLFVVLLFQENRVEE